MWQWEIIENVWFAMTLLGVWKEGKFVSYISINITLHLEWGIIAVFNVIWYFFICWISVEQILYNTFLHVIVAQRCSCRFT